MRRPRARVRRRSGLQPRTLRPAYPSGWRATSRLLSVAPAREHLVHLLRGRLDHPAWPRRAVMATGGPTPRPGCRVVVVAEEVRWHLDSVERQLVEDLGPQAGGHQATKALVHVDPVEDVLQEDGRSFNPLDLGDGMH